MLVLKDFTFDAAHRLIQDYPGKCRWLHGHTYKVEVAVKGRDTDNYGMLIDFDAIKQKMQAYVNENMDHGTIVAPDDTVLLQFLVAQKQKHFVLVGFNNPTAENIAHYLFTAFHVMLMGYKTERADSCSDLRLDWVRVWETPTSSAVHNG